MKRCMTLLMALFISVTFSSCTKDDTVTRQSFAFDTVITITADKKYQDEISTALDMCQDYELVFSRTNEKSELYKINNKTTSEPSEDLRELIDFSLSVSKLTDGAFDITVAPLVDLWDIKERTSPPQDAQIESALSKVGYESISMEPFSTGDATLDLGAVAKGYIADRLTDYFKENGVDDAIIDLGGNVAIIGEHTVGIRDPENSDGIFAVMTVKDKSAVTSGAYQRYFEYEGERYHHIIDPRTGRCAQSDVMSVTVISPSSTVADALSTSIYILGEDALSLCGEFPDTDAIIIKEGGVTVTTDGFAEKYALELYNPD